MTAGKLFFAVSESKVSICSHSSISVRFIGFILIKLFLSVFK